jgi:hypothetical protein
VPRKKSKKLNWPTARRMLDVDTFWEVVDSSDQDRPVSIRLKLYRLLADQLERAFELMEEGLAGDLGEEQIAELSLLADKIVKIQSWIFGPHGKRAEEELVKELMASMHAGATAKWALAVVDRARAGRAGAPLTMSRPRGVAALDLHRAEPDLSWGEIAKRLCDCGKARHTNKCAEKLRGQGNNVLAFIKRLERP